MGKAGGGGGGGRGVVGEGGGREGESGGREGEWGGREGEWGAGRWLKTAEILLVESCHEQVSFESGLKQQKGRRISEIG